MTPVRLAILGAGRAGAMVMYPPALADNPRFVLDAVYDPNRANSEALVAAVGQGRVAASLEQVWAGASEAVIVASPVQFHQAQSVAALSTGRHVLVEKPMARTVGECRTIERAGRAAGRVLMVGFMKRFDRAFKRAKELVEAGALGQMIEVRCDWSHCSPLPADGSRAHPDAWGGTFQDHGSHTIDLCRWWLGDVTQVSAEMRIAFADRCNEDSAVAILAHTGGTFSTHNISRVRQGPMLERYELIGTRASLQIQYAGMASYMSADPFTLTLRQPGGITRDLTPKNIPNLRAEIARNGRYSRELAHFAECVRGLADTETDAAIGVAAIEVVEAAYCSAATGCKVALPLRESINLPDYFAALARRAGPGN